MHLPDGVYRAGFAGTQEAYEKAVYPLFGSLDRLEKILTDKNYLVGDTLTEADIRLFVTIVSASIAPVIPIPIIPPRRFASIQCTLGSLNATCVRSEMGTLPFTREILMSSKRSGVTKRSIVWVILCIDGCASCTGIMTHSSPRRISSTSKSIITGPRTRSVSTYS